MFNSSIMGEQFRRILDGANSAFRTADHLAYVSYPLLKDKRLLLAITQNLYLAGVKCMDALLYYERLYKRLNILPADFDSRFHLFSREVAPRMKLKPGAVKVIKDLHMLSKQHKDSPIEFFRRDKIVMCSEDYSSVKTIDIELLKNYIVDMRNFLEVVNKLK